MRIVFAHNDYGRPSGEEHACESLAELLTTHGHGVDWFRRSSAELNGSSVSLIKAFFAGIHNPSAKREMARRLAAFQPDIVQVQNLYPLLSPSVLDACSSARVPVVMRCPNYRLFCPSGLHLSHGRPCDRCLGGKEYWCVLRNCESSWLKSLGYALRNAVARLRQSILRSVTVFAVLSEFQRDRFIRCGIPAERVEVLPNIVPDVPESHHDEPGDLITFVGRVSPEKGIEDFVAAARRLPNLPFAVAGATDRMPDLVANSPSNIEWLGFLKEDDLNAVCSRSRLLVCPSRCFEGFPNVITRAMALGKPVVAARSGAIAEIVSDGVTGLLFEPGTVEELVANIRSLHPDVPRCRQMGQAGRKKALTEYCPDIVYARLIKIYRKALGHAV